jgi:hypothetical protein
MALIYSLETINGIIFNGFNYELPVNTLAVISELAKQVGAPNYIKTPNFQNKNIAISKPLEKDISTYKKRKDKPIEIVNEDEWNALKTVQTMSKNDIDMHIDIIRSCLNKLTDKNYPETLHNIYKIMDELLEKNGTPENMSIIASVIFDIASTNRFYSKIYANLYNELSQRYTIMKCVFETNFGGFLDLFNSIEYVEPDVDYNKFIKNNEINEKKKSLASFYFYLMKTNLVSEFQIIKTIKDLLQQVYEFINIENKKKEVDELTEIIAILYKKDIFDKHLLNNHLIHDKTILQIIEIIANTKIKDCKSLTNKSLFKFMDMIEM